jgi:catechol 2,3-dioxygenase-like lactoylglutathione lyase family enzyme
MMLPDRRNSPSYQERIMSPNFVILYVANPLTSAEFYADLLGLTAVEKSPTFAMFALDSGVMLGLWAVPTVEPTAHLTGGGTELAFTVADRNAVDTLHADWKQRGLSIAQQPTAMDFGYTFTALDPDGHRLRVFFPVSA